MKDELDGLGGSVWGWQALLRHFATIIVMLGGLWWLATPRVEAFIEGAVDARIRRIESKLDDIEVKLVHIQTTLDAPVPGGPK